MQEVRLEEEVEINPVAMDTILFGTGFSQDGKHVPLEKIYSEPAENKKSGWGSSWGAATPKSFTQDNPKPSEQGFTRPGMVGKVWLINHVTKERARVAPDEVDAMLANGWEKGGPKTAFKADGGTW